MVLDLSIIDPAVHRGETPNTNTQEESKYEEEKKNVKNQLSN